MYGERLINWLPKICIHELLEPSATQRERSIDVSFISISRVRFASYKNFSESQVHAGVVL